MSDFTTTNYSPKPNQNGVKQPPLGLPVGSNANTLGGTIRTLMAATKRGFDALNTMVTAGGSVNELTLTYEVAPASPHPKGVIFNFWAGASNTGAATLSVNGIGPHQLVDAFGAALPPGVIVAGNAYSATFDGTRFRLSGGITKSDLDAAISTATAPLLKRAGDRLTGSLSSAVKDHGTLGAVTEEYKFADANTHRVTVNGAHTIVPTGLAEGDTLQLNLLFQSGSIAVSGTTQWELGGGAKSSSIADVGVTLTVGAAYRIIFEVVAGVRTAVFQ